MYTLDSKVRYSEIDHRGTMTLPALINYFQDCSTFQSESLGFGVKAAKEKKKAWILFFIDELFNGRFFSSYYCDDSLRSFRIRKMSAYIFTDKLVFPSS